MGGKGSVTLWISDAGVCRTASITTKSIHNIYSLHNETSETIIIIIVVRNVIIFNRPAVAGAVLHRSMLLINWLIHSSLSSKSSKHYNSQTVWAKELKFWHNVHLQSCVKCHISLGTCAMSYVRYQMPEVEIFFTTFMGVLTHTYISSREPPGCLVMEDWGNCLQLHPRKEAIDHTQ